jgi:fido (protein-threonine AMPylation protein)
MRAGRGNSPATPSGSTRPLGATREPDTAQGVLTYSEVSEHLAVNIAHVLENILDGAPEQIQITPDWIREIHHQLAGDFFPDWAGRFRTAEAQVGTHYFNALRGADRGDFNALNNLWMERLSS